MPAAAAAGIASGVIEPAADNRPAMNRPPVTGAAGSPGGPVGGLVGALASGVFDDLSAGFVQSADQLLRQLGSVFVASSTVDLSGSGIDQLVSVTVPVAALVATVLVVMSAASTAWTQNGSPLATSLLGLARAGLICGSLVAVVQVSLRACDDVSSWIVDRTFGSDPALAARLGAAADSVNVAGPALRVLVAAIAIVLALLLWAEMLLRHVAIVLLVATAPVAAAGLVSTSTGSWWPRARSALVQLVVLKPVVVLCLAVGFGEFGNAGDLNSAISAMITLAAAAFAWPMLARFMTFTTVGAGSGLVATVTAGTAAMAAGQLRGAREGAGRQVGAGYALGVEAENDLAVGGRALAAPAESAIGGGAATTTLAAGQAAASIVQHTRKAVDAMAAHADLAPPSPTWPLVQHWPAPTSDQRGDR